MTQTAEDRKISRLEAKVKTLKAKIEDLESIARWNETRLYNEREWPHRPPSTTSNRPRRTSRTPSNPPKRRALNTTTPERN